MYVQTALILCLGVAGLLAAPESYKTASAAGFGPDGYQYASNPNGVYISGPGYYAGATTFTSGSPPPNFPNFPAFNFPQFNPFANIFGGPGTYAPQFPFSFGNIYQSYLNALAQNNAAIASIAKKTRYPIKYSSPPKERSSSSSSSSASSSSFVFPNFPPQAPLFPPLPPIDFGSLGNRFGEEGNSVGSSVSSSTSSVSQPGGQGVFSSSVQGSTNVNGQEQSFHLSSTGTHENGQVTSVTVHKP